MLSKKLIDNLTPIKKSDENETPSRSSNMMMAWLNKKVTKKAEEDESSKAAVIKKIDYNSQKIETKEPAKKEKTTPVKANSKSISYKLAVVDSSDDDEKPFKVKKKADKEPEPKTKIEPKTSKLN